MAQWDEHVDINIDVGNLSVMNVQARGGLVYMSGVNYDTGKAFVMVANKPEGLDLSRKNLNAETVQGMMNDGHETVEFSQKGYDRSKVMDSLNENINNGHDVGGSMNVALMEQHGITRTDARELQYRHTSDELKAKIDKAYPDGPEAPAAPKARTNDGFTKVDNYSKGSAHANFNNAASHGGLLGKVALLAIASIEAARAENAQPEDVAKEMAKAAAPKVAAAVTALADGKADPKDIGMAVVGTVSQAAAAAVQGDFAGAQKAAKVEGAEMGGGLAGAAVGAVLGIPLGPVGIAVGGVVGGVAGAMGAGSVAEYFVKTPEEHRADIEAQQVPLLAELADRFPNGVKGKPIGEALKRPNDREAIKEALRDDPQGLKIMEKYSVLAQEKAALGVSAPDPALVVAPKESAQQVPVQKAQAPTMSAPAV